MHALALVLQEMYMKLLRNCTFDVTDVIKV